MSKRKPIDFESLRREQTPDSSKSYDFAAKYYTGPKEVALFKELSQTMINYCTSYQTHADQVHKKAVKKLQNQISSELNDVRMEHFNMEALMAVMNPGSRKQMQKSRLLEQCSEMKDTSTMLQQHKDEFEQEMLQRRSALKTELRASLSTGLASVKNLGELISQTTRDLISVAGMHESVILARLGAEWGFFDAGDFEGLLSKNVYLSKTPDSSFLEFSKNCLEFTLSTELLEGTTWIAAFADKGFMRASISSVPLELDMCLTAREHVQKALDQDDTTISFLHLIARLADVIHPGSQVLSDIAIYPLFAMNVLKKRLSALGYNVADSENLMSGACTCKFAIQILKQMISTHEHLCTAVFEFSTNARSAWRVGLICSTISKKVNRLFYPGMDDSSLGIGSNGFAYFRGSGVRCVALSMHLRHFDAAERNFTILTDLHKGALCMETESSRIVIFGTGAMHFSSEDQELQSTMIKTRFLVVCFATDGSLSLPESPISLKVNFGHQKFLFSKGQSLNSFLSYIPPRLKTFSIFQQPNKSMQNDENKILLTLERTHMWTSLKIKEEVSWSHFPPSVYVRSIAAGKIQRTWRIYHSRKVRRRIIEENTKATCVLQRVVRRMLLRKKRLKNAAARLIQRTWRINVYLKRCLLSLKFKMGIPALHEAAKIIQTWFRKITYGPNQKLLAIYGARLQDVINAGLVISRWWKKAHTRLLKRRYEESRNNAAMKIQKTWRGLALRKMLRLPIRIKLLGLGEIMVANKELLKKLWAIHIIQRIFRAYYARMIRLKRIRTRNGAATKIQKLWRGYWVRTSIPSTFDYGETVFLLAVGRCFKNSNFNIKMYKPCGVVCPKRQ